MKSKSKRKAKGTITPEHPMTGVTYKPNSSRTGKNWHAQIFVLGKRIQKQFKTKEEAIAQRLEWGKMYINENSSSTVDNALAIMDSVNSIVDEEEKADVTVENADFSENEIPIPTVMLYTEPAEREAITPIEKFYDSQLAILKQIQVQNEMFYKQLNESFSVLSCVIQSLVEMNVSTTASTTVSTALESLKSYTPKEPEEYSKFEFVDRSTKEYINWKSELDDKASEILLYENKCANKRELYNDILEEMRNQYGIVYEQDIKEYKKQFNADHYVTALEIVYASSIYKGIFDSKLDDRLKYVRNNPDFRWDRIKKKVFDYLDACGKDHTASKGVYNHILLNMGVDWKVSYGHLLAYGIKKMDIVKQEVDLGQKFEKDLDLFLLDEYEKMGK